MFTAAARLFLALALASTLSACTQGEGDHCQVDSDCASGLICAIPSNVLLGGTCRTIATGDMATPQPDTAMAPVPDMTVQPDQ